METTVGRNDIFTALQSLLKVIPNKATLPSLEMVHIETDGGGPIRLSGTNLDASLRIDIDAHTEAQGAALAPAKMLKNILNGAPKGAHIHLTAEQEGNSPMTTLEFGKSSYSAYGLDPSEFPTMPEVEGVAFDTGNLATVLDKVLFAASTEESRPMLQSVYFEIDGSDVYAVATNGHVLARYQVSASVRDDDAQSFIVPASELKAALKWKHTEVGIQGRFCAFSSDESVLTIRALEGPYPNYRQVIPTDNGKTFTTDRKALEAAAKRLSVIASDQSGRVVLSCDKECVTLSAENPSAGKATEMLDGIYDGGEDDAGIDIGFDVRYILNILKRFDGDTVTIKMRAPERAAVIESDGDLDYMCLLMPLRVV